MDTGIGDRENTGRHLNPATKVCTKRSDGKTIRPTPKCIETISQSQRGFDLSEI